MNDKPITIQFVEGCFDDMDPEEANDLRREIEEAFLSGEFFEDAELVDMDQLAEDDPDLYRKLVVQLEALESPTLH